MPEGNAEVIRDGYEAFGRGDIPAVMSILREDVEWHVPTVMPQGMDATGHEGVGGFFQRLGSLWEDLKLEVDDLLTSEDEVAAVGSATGKVGGVERAYGFVHKWTLENGKVVRFHEYVDIERDTFAAT